MLGTWACTLPLFPGTSSDLCGAGPSPGLRPTLTPPLWGQSPLCPQGWDWVRQGQGGLSHLRAP